MSIFSKVGGFFKKVGADFESLWNKTPALTQQIASTLSYITPMITLLFSLFDPGDAAEVADVTHETQAALATVKSISSIASPGPTDLQTAQNALNAVKTNLTGLLNAAQVKNSGNAAKISDTGNAIIDELNAMLQSLSTATGSQAAAATA